MENYQKNNNINIFNVRLGFAANSSSTHSLIIMDNPPKHDSQINEYEFGWDYFTASTEKTKRTYCALTLASCLRKQGLPHSMIDAIVEKWSGVDIVDHDNIHSEYDRYCGYIDHQSIYDLPKDWGNKGVSKEFYDEFMNIILNPNLVILGGNDNGEDEWNHPLVIKSKEKPFTFAFNQDSSSSMVARRDPEYNYWLLFNREDGTKLRIGMDLCRVTPSRASIPELVDIGMGTMCNKGCAFCYTGATSNGEMANHENINAIISALGELQVAEIALGQMEPTLYPEFDKILSACRYYNIVPNFTTRDTNWLRNNKIWPKIIELVGGFAFSVSSASEITEFMNIIRYNNISISKTSIQCVMGTVDSYDFENILTTAHKENIPITLLGFKNTNRGANYEKIDYTNIFEKVITPLREKGRCPKLSIDTLLAKEWEKQLSDVGIPKILYTTQEGKFSCYIDATNMRIGSSSYCDESQMYDLGTNKNYELAGAIKEHFAKF